MAFSMVPILTPTTWCKSTTNAKIEARSHSRFTCKVPEALQAVLQFKLLWRKYGYKKGNSDMRVLRQLQPR